MSKTLIAMDKSGSFRVYITVTTDMVQQAQDIHQTTPLGTAAMGRVLTAAGLMAIMLKEEEGKLTVNFKGEGPAKQILATAYADGRVKGYIANPQVDLPLASSGKLDVGGAIGLGDLTVIKDLGLKEPYMGTIALVSGEIAEDLAAYFFISEQQNTSVALGVKIETDYSVGAAGGMIIQMLPGSDEGAVDALEKLIGEMDPITSIIDDAKATGGLSETGLVRKVLEDIFATMPEEYAVEELEEREIRWECDCSREKIEEVLTTIGEDDLREIIEEDGQAELQCHFCLKKYQFDKEELEAILQGGVSKSHES